MFSIEKQKFGAFVAALRKEKGLTQKELAQMLYVSDKAVSKWETGASIPDTALLIPLAELLGVTVTELLQCQRNPEGEPLDAKEVETVIKTVVSYAGAEKPRRSWRKKSQWQTVYFISVLAGVVLLFLCGQMGCLSVVEWIFAGFGVAYGGYFALMAPLQLPKMYDENKISFFCDGPLRMHMPGLYFNNQNWMFICKAAVLWSCIVLVAAPMIAFVLNLWLPESWVQGKNVVLLLVYLGSLFTLMYMASKKQQCRKRK